MTMENPAARVASRVPETIKALGGVDRQEPKAFTPKIQSETLAVRTLMKRFGLTIHHARLVSELAGIGGVV
jgi:hypothetical protein